MSIELELDDGNWEGYYAFPTEAQSVKLPFYRSYNWDEIPGDTFEMMTRQYNDVIQFVVVYVNEDILEYVKECDCKIIISNNKSETYALKIEGPPEILVMIKMIV